MAKFWLVNTVLLGATKMFPGDSVNDATEDANAIRAAGGFLWPQGTVAVDLAALRATSARLNKGTSEAELEEIMQVAIDASQISFDPAALAVGAWRINALTGDDNALGGPGAPLKTLAQWQKRLGIGQTLPGVFSAVVTPHQEVSVVFETDIPISDPLVLDCCLPGNALLAFVGTMQTIRTGTFTAVTAKNRATNTPWEVSDGVTPFTAADLGKRIRITAGPNIGQFAWIIKITAGAARCTSFSSVSLATPASLLQTGVTTGVVLVGDAYVVERPSTLTVTKCNVFSPVGGPNTNTIVGFMDLSWEDPGGFTSLMGNTTGSHTFVTKGCLFNGQFLLEHNTIGRANILNCFTFGNAFFPVFGLSLSRCGPVVRSGGCNTNLACRGTLAIMDDDFTVQASPFVNGVSVEDGSPIFGAVAVFDAGGNGISIGTSGENTRCGINQGFQFSGVQQCWGSGNAGAGLEVTGGCQFTYDGSVPPTMTITGGGGDFALGGQTSSSPWDQSAAAGAGAYLPPILNTWANLAAALPVGFGGHAHNLLVNAHITPTF